MGSACHLCAFGSLDQAAHREIGCCYGRPCVAERDPGPALLPIEPSPKLKKRKVMTLKPVYQVKDGEETKLLGVPLKPTVQPSQGP